MPVVQMSLIDRHIILSCNEVADNEMSVTDRQTDRSVTVHIAPCIGL